MVFSRVRRPAKAFWTIVRAALLALCIVATGICFRIRLANEWERYSPVRPMEAPGAGQSIIVFAPHCDDETLGCGGMISMALSQGARVKVVLFTNGDGYRVAAARAYHTMNISKADFVRLAYARQQETLSALRLLGVSRECAIFLGYPDRGLMKLWETNWSGSDRYTSRYTGWDRALYGNAYSYGAPYCGESVLADVMSVIRNVGPSDIYIPHPSDNHPDHCAAYCFVTAALEQLVSDGFALAGKIDVHTYLVHRGDWPGQRDRGDANVLSPPGALANGDTQWYSLMLSQKAAKQKAEAIRCYRTQMAITKGFLLTFARRNDLFGAITERLVHRVGDRRIKVDGQVDDWSGITPQIVDAVGDYVMAGLEKSGDVRAIYTCADSRYFYVRMDFVGKVSRRVRYNLNLRSLGPDESAEKLSIIIRPSRRDTGRPDTLVGRSGGDWASGRRSIECRVPLDSLDFDSDVYVQLDTRIMKVLIDNTGWHGLKLAEH